MAGGGTGCGSSDKLSGELGSASDSGGGASDSAGIHASCTVFNCTDAGAGSGARATGGAAGAPAGSGAPALGRGIRKGFGFAGSTTAGSALSPRSADETPIIVRARGSRLEPGGLPGALLGSKPLLLNGSDPEPGASALS